MARTIISILCFIGAGAIFFMYTQPAYDEVQKTNGQIAQYDEALQKAAELQQLKQTLLSKFNTFNPSDVDRLQKLLPDHVDNVRLILDIDSLASKHSMAVQNVVVSNTQVAQGAQTAIGAVSSSKQKYDSLTIKFTTQGTYDQFRTFLQDLGQSLRIVDLTSLTVTRTTDSTTAIGGGSTPIFSYDVSLKTYWLK